MAQEFVSSAISAEDFELRFCDPNSVNSNSDRQFTFSRTDPLSKIKIWKEFLEETTDIDNIRPDYFFDLPEQTIIDADCEMFIAESEIPEDKKEQKLLALRKIINVYSRSEKETYESGNGWIPLLGRIILDSDSVLDIYSSFKTIKDTYVPTPRTRGFILMLLLRYHDPSFYNWINDHDISLDQCTASWFNSLFAENCTKQVCNFLWDSFIKSNDSFRIFFIALSIILLQKSNIMEMESNSKKKITDTIKLFPNLINTQNLIDVLENTKKLNITIPPFFREAFGSFMFGDQREPTPEWLPLILPLSVISMLENLRGLESPYIISDYFIVDCRPSDQYEGGHFSFKHNYHVDYRLLSESSTENYTIDDIQLLIKRIKEAEKTSKNKEIHICLIGSNLSTNDKYVYIVARELLKQNRKYVSVLYGGYKIIHNTLKVEEQFDDYAVDHNEKKCIVCSPIEKKLTDHLRKKLVKSKKRLLNCFNSTDDNCEDTFNDIKYKFNEVNFDKNVLVDNEPISQAPSIDSDIHEVNFDKNAVVNNEPISQAQSIDSIVNGVANPSINSWQCQTKFKIISMNEWLTLPNAVPFKCLEITSDDHKLESVLLITDTEFIHLRLMKDFQENAYLIVNCHLFFIESIRRRIDNHQMIVTFDRPDINIKNENLLIPFDEVRYKIREIEKFMQVYDERYCILKRQLQLNEI